MVYVTPIVVENFRRWLKRVFPPDFDFQVIGIDIEDPNSIRRYLEEMCPDLTYRECLDHLLKVYEGVAKGEGGQEALELALQELSHYYGTMYVNDAFKKLYERLGDRVVDELEKPDHGMLKPIEEVLGLKYGCIDFDIRKFSELPELGFRVQKIWYGDVVLFAHDLERSMGLSQARSMLELFGSPHNIGVASRIEDTFLVCIRVYKYDRIEDATVIASAIEPYVLIHFPSRRYGIII